MSELRSLQSEWNALVPVAHELGIFSGVRILRSTHENIQVGRSRLAALQARIAARQGTSTSTAALNAGTDTTTFGVELEVIMPRGLSHFGLANIITAAGIACHAEGYNHVTGSDWKVVTDGSLQNYISGAEVVSPILSGEAGMATLKTVMDAIRGAGCKISKRCGTHVHIGARNENVNFFRNLALIYRRFDATIDSVLAPSRRNNGFALAHRINAMALAAATTVDEVTAAVGQMPGARFVRTGHRYRKLNFCSYYQHGTVEFRQHQGSVEYNKVAQWIKLIMAMVAVARTNVDLSGEYTLDTLINLLGMDTSQAAYWRSRQSFFAARSRRVA